jgi:hypothetical protein
MAVRTYRNKLRLAFALTLAVTLAAAVAGGRIARLGDPGENFWLVYPALLTVMGLVFLGTYPWWRRLDDVQRQSHLVSWYWGGMIGGVVVLMALIAGAGVHSDLARGGVFVIVGQAIGFAIFLVIRQVRGRAPEA